MRPLKVSPLRIAALLAMQSSLGTAWGVEECGATPGGIEPVITCSSDPSQYSTGITYLQPLLPNGLQLHLDPTVTIVRAAGVGNHGVDLATNSTNALRVMIAEGARISVNGANAQGVKLRGRGDLSVDASGRIEVADSTAVDGSPSVAIYAEISDPTATGNIVVNHRQSSQLIGVGDESGGIAVAHDGHGSALVTSAGEIQASGGDYITGINVWARTPGGTADVKVVQTETGRISVDSAYGTGIYALSEGLGAADIEIHGSVKAAGDMSGALLSLATSAADAARVSISAGPTSYIDAKGTAVTGMYALTQGLGEVTATSAGQVHVEGNQA